MTIEVSSPYTKREARFLELWRPNHWQIKCYGIAHPDRDLPDDTMLTAAKDLLTDVLPSAHSKEHHGVGFLIIHAAREAVFLLLDLWAGENMLRQHLFASTYDNPTEFRDLADTGLMACVWEMSIQSFERQAWVECVLDNPQGPSLAAYLSKQLSGFV